MLLIDRFHSQWRRQQQKEIDAGGLHKIDELALLEEPHLRVLAWLSLFMLVIGTVLFVGLDLFAYYGQTYHWLAPLSFWGIVLWIVLNIVGYMLILPVHELIHGLSFILWGGRPHFGARLPLALFCGAQDQLFRRSHYLVVGLAPLVVLTLLGVVVTLLAPGIASYLLLAFAGNFSGAAGDVLVAQRISRLSSPHVLIEDTETGYTAWEITGDEFGSPAAPQSI